MNKIKKFTINKNILKFHDNLLEIDLKSIYQGRIIYHTLKMNYEVPELSETILELRKILRKKRCYLSIGDRKMTVDWHDRKLFLGEPQTNILYQEMKKYYKRNKINNDDFWFVVSEYADIRHMKKVKKYYTDTGILKKELVKGEC